MPLQKKLSRAAEGEEGEWQRYVFGAFVISTPRAHRAGLPSHLRRTGSGVLVRFSFRVVASKLYSGGFARKRETGGRERETVGISHGSPSFPLYFLYLVPCFSLSLSFLSLFCSRPHCRSGKVNRYWKFNYCVRFPTRQSTFVIFNERALRERERRSGAGAM